MSHGTVRKPVPVYRVVRGLKLIFFVFGKRTTECGVDCKLDVPEWEFTTSQPQSLPPVCIFFSLLTDRLRGRQSYRDPKINAYFFCKTYIFILLCGMRLYFSVSGC